MWNEHILHPEHIKSHSFYTLSQLKALYRKYIINTWILFIVFWYASHHISTCQTFNFFLYLFFYVKTSFLLKILNVFCFLSFLKSPLPSVKIATWGKPIFSVKTLQSQWRGSFTAVPPVGGMVSLPSCEMLLFLIH